MACINPCFLLPDLSFQIFSSIKLNLDGDSSDNKCVLIEDKDNKLFAPIVDASVPFTESDVLDVLRSPFRPTPTQRTILLSGVLATPLNVLQSIKKGA